MAILDTSIRGEEPSVEPDGRSAFIHNGEIYNFRALRRRLEARGERFVSESDGEIAHRLLRREGPGALTELEGMFALALWDGTGRRLLVARDRLGIKPLYYALSTAGIAFASEPRALLEFPGIQSRRAGSPLRGLQADRRSALDTPGGIPRRGDRAAPRARVHRPVLPRSRLLHGRRAATGPRAGRGGPGLALVARGTQRRNNKVWLLLNLEAWYRRWIRGRRSTLTVDS